MSPNLAALPQGTRLQNGDYALGPVLGQGGFGITYKGGEMATKRYVAIKEFFPPGAIRQGAGVIPSSLTGEKHPQAISEFLREAQTLARFHDPGIVRVLGTFEANNTAYMVMEFLEGQTLAARIAAKGALDEWEVLDIGLRLAGALEVIHGAGILHRDIKPENVMLAKGGRAVLIDFGTARVFEGTTQRMTQVVTPGYAPLEQYASNARRGPTTDIYALGATMYHALSGVIPVVATDRAVDVPLPSLRTLKPSLSPLIANAVMSALEMDMARRPPTAAAFVARLKGSPTPLTPNRDALPDFSTGALPRAPGAPVHVPTRTPAVAGPDGLDATAPSMTIHSTLERHTSGVNAIAFSPDGTKLLSAGADRLIYVWHTQMSALSSSFGAHTQAVNSMAFSPDNVWIATGGRDEHVCIWDATLPPVTTKRAPLAILTDCRGVVNEVAFCPTRRELLVGDAGALTLWDAATGQVKVRHEMGAVTAAWSPDGAAIAMASALSGVMHLCNGVDLSPLGQLPAHQGELTDVAYSPEGTRLASIGTDGFVRVWNAAQGVLLWEQSVVVSGSACLAWSQDGRLLASASRDGVLLWTNTGQLWRRYTRHKDRIQSLAFAPSPPAPYSYILASASRDKTVNVCRLNADALP